MLLFLFILKIIICSTPAQVREAHAGQVGVGRRDGGAGVHLEREPPAETAVEEEQGNDDDVMNSSCDGDEDDKEFNDDDNDYADDNNQ